MSKDVIALFKIGDQDVPEYPYKNGDLVDVIDLEEQIPGYEIGEDAKRIFYCAKIDRSEKDAYRAALRDFVVEEADGEKVLKEFIPTKAVLDIKALPAKLKSDIEDPTKVVEIAQIDSKVVSFTPDEIKNPPLKDINAWTGDDVYIGPGDPYPTWLALSSDLGTFSSTGHARQTDYVLETNGANFSNDCGGYSITLDGQGYDIEHYKNSTFWAMNCTNADNVEVKNIRVHAKNTGTDVGAQLYRYSGTANKVLWHHNYFDVAGYWSGYGVMTLLKDSDYMIYSNIIMGGYYAILVNGTPGPGTRIDGNVVYNSRYGIDLLYRTIASLTNNAIFCSIGNAYRRTTGAQVFLSNASHDGSGTVGLQNLVASQVFESLDKANEKFLWPKRHGTLQDAGIASPIPERLTYYNDVIIRSEVFVGANGLPSGVSGGDWKIGPGEKYESWYDLSKDMEATLDSKLSVKSIATLQEDKEIAISVNQAGYDIVFDGGEQLMHSTISVFYSLFSLSPSGMGNFEIKNFIADIPAFGGADAVFNLRGSSPSVHYDIHDNTLFGSEGAITINTASSVKAYNNVLKGGNRGINVISGTSSSIVENNTILDQHFWGIDGGNSAVVFAKNYSGGNDGPAYTNMPSSWTHNASDDATGNEGFRNISIASAFQSNDPTSTRYLWPRKGHQLNGTGGSKLLDNTLYYNGFVVNHRAADIGANGIKIPTKYIDLAPVHGGKGHEHYVKEFRRLVLYVAPESNAELKITYKVDNDISTEKSKIVSINPQSSGEWGTLEWGTGTWGSKLRILKIRIVLNHAVGRYLQVRIAQDNNLGDKFLLYEAYVNYNLKSLRGY